MNISTIIAGVALMIALLALTNVRDMKVAESAKAYETCVARQYHTSPAAFYAENGRYPICN